MVQDFGLSDLAFCLGVLQIMRNHFEIERMTGGYRPPSPPPAPFSPIYVWQPHHYDIGQQKTCKSAEWAVSLLL